MIESELINVFTTGGIGAMMAVLIYKVLKDSVEALRTENNVNHAKMLENQNVISTNLAIVAKHLEAKK